MLSIRIVLRSNQSSSKVKIKFKLLSNLLTSAPAFDWPRGLYKTRTSTSMTN